MCTKQLKKLWFWSPPGWCFLSGKLPGRCWAWLTLEPGKDPPEPSPPPWTATSTMDTESTYSGYSYYSGRSRGSHRHGWVWLAWASTRSEALINTSTFKPDSTILRYFELFRYLFCSFPFYRDISCALKCFSLIWKLNNCGRRAPGWPYENRNTVFPINISINKYKTLIHRNQIWPLKFWFSVQVGSGGSSHGGLAEAH